MKKKLMVNLAALLLVVTQGVSELARLPQSLLLWGEPTPPMEKPEK